MTLYHGSNIANIKILKPSQADHDRPYVYMNALKEVSEGVSGYIYEVLAEEEQVIPFKNIPCARLATEPIGVTKCVHVENAYDLFMEYVKRGKMKISHFEDKSEQQLEWWCSCIVEYLKEKNMIETSECSYALFIKERIPQVWEKYLRTVNRR